MDTIRILTGAVDARASDIFIVVGLPVSYKANGQIYQIGDHPLTPEDTETILRDIFSFANGRDMRPFLQQGDDDFSFSLQGVSRFRASAYRQRGTLAVVIRVVNFDLPDPKELSIPDSVLSLTGLQKGLVLVTGSAGSGKSTTLACLIDLINQNRTAHVITLEDPLEYLHRHNRSIVSQREILSDTVSYVAALRAALRQSPDVVLLGEMRDYETINVAMTAAETGHLIFSTLHTVGVANSIDRIIDVFPPEGQHQIRVQLAMVLQAVVSQQLVPTVDGRVIPAFEIMIANSAIRNMIRESKVHQIETTLYSSQSEGMVTMDTSLLRLYRQGLITDKTAITYAANPETMQKKLG